MSKEILRLPVIPRYIQEILQMNTFLWNVCDEDDRNVQLETWSAAIKNRLLQLRGDLQEKPDCSVVIPACDEEKYILMLLESIARQNTSYKTEVVVVDNNSSPSDRTAEIAKAAGATVISYQRKTSSPIGLARNVGLLSASGTYVCTTDADCILPQNWINTMVGVLERNKQVACATVNIAHYDGTLPLRLYDAASILSRNFTNAVQTSHASAQGMAFRREVAISVGGYDLREQVRDDMSLCKRLQTIGKKQLVNSPDAVVYASARRVKREGIFRSLFLMQVGLNYDGYLSEEKKLKNHR